MWQIIRIKYLLIMSNTIKLKHLQSKGKEGVACRTPPPPSHINTTGLNPSQNGLRIPTAFPLVPLLDSTISPKDTIRGCG